MTKRKGEEEQVTTAEVVQDGDGDQAVEYVAAEPVFGAFGSQATMVEAARVLGEVRAQVMLARQYPRRIRQVTENMLAACSREKMAEQAFYAYRRGGSLITGPSVQLLREIGRIFGNVQSGTAELNRLADRSEMLAYAWDLETNFRESTIFFVMHRRDRSEEHGGAVELTTGRDIYENNANAAARRERAMLERVLPAWYVEMAKEAAHKKLTGDPAQFEQQVERVLTEFATVFGVRERDLVDRLGAPREVWTPVDLATMKVLGASLKRGEADLVEEFPNLNRGGQGSAADSLRAAANDAGDQAEAAQEPPPRRGGRRRSQPRPESQPQQEEGGGGESG